jgi:LysM repeat protein
MMRHISLAALAWSLILSAALFTGLQEAVHARSHWQEGTPTATLEVVPIVISTPRPDGSIIHVVQSGQFLANIAVAYGIPLQELLNINGLTAQTVIFPGEALIIRLPSTLLPPTTGTPAATASGSPVATVAGAATGTEASGAAGTPSPEQQASATPRPVEPTLTATEAASTSTPAPESFAPEASAPPSPPATELAAPEPRQDSGGPDFLLIAVLILGATGTALVALGSALKRGG